MRKKCLAILLAVVLAVGLLPAAAFAADAPTSGTCGVGTTWNYSNGVLTITGEGFVQGYDLPVGQPWYALRDEIQTVIIKDGVTAIGMFAFQEYSMTSVTLPVSVTSISVYVFDRCADLKDVYYGGSKSQWNQITIGVGNDPLLNTAIHCTDGDITPDPEPGGNEPGTETSDPKTPFPDVTPGIWYEDAVQYTVERGLFKGSNGKFNPAGTLTRGETFTILARLDGADTSGSNPWYQKGVEWSKAKGVSNGSNPLGKITRQELAVMLYRYAGNPDADISVLDGYSDGSGVANWTDFREAMAWAVGNGIITGNKGRLNPSGTATRAEAATILMRFCENAVS